MAKDNVDVSSDLSSLLGELSKIKKVSKNNSASYSDVDNTAETSYTDVTAA